MSKVRKSHSDEDFSLGAQNIIETPLHEEVQQSFLEYSYSVIGSRALPDARDGLKPVHRRILFTMKEMGLRPDHAFVKVARVVGEVLGKHHPHGDSSVADALVRMGQDFSLSLPLIEGHGNFGSPDSGAAAMRYIECRLDKAAMPLVGELDEETVDFVPNYDGSLTEPSVLPAAFPNLLVNGSTGIAVGMSTNMPPHNLGETIAAARVLIGNPEATLKEITKHIKGPDFPSGAEVIGADGVKELYETGKGAFRIRGTVEIAALEGSRGRQQITVVELPYGVGCEKIIADAKKAISEKRLQGVSDIIDLSDGNGTRLVFELKTGSNPQTVVNALCKYTSLEVGFSAVNLALVDGQPKTLNLKELLEVFLGHRYEVVTRRTEYRLRRAEARLHIVEGLLIALDAIDEVVKIIRGSKQTSEAREKLAKRFKLSDIQCSHILEMPLRRLTSLEVTSLREEKKELEAAIKGFKKILGSEVELKAVVDAELAEVAAALAVPRRSRLVSGSLESHKAAVEESVASVKAGGELSVAVADEPVRLVLTAAGVLRAAGSFEGKAGKADPAVHVVDSTTGSHVLLVSEAGVAVKVAVAGVLDGVDAKSAAGVRDRIVGVIPMGANYVLGTECGVVKAGKPDYPQRGDEFSIVSLESGDRVLWVGVASDGNDVVFVSSDASLLRFPVASVRAQGRSGGGMAGIKLADGNKVVSFACVPAVSSTLVTVTDAGTVKQTPLSEYPTKGRATGGVRSHKFLKGETALAKAFLVPSDDNVPLDAASKKTTLPAAGKRDGSGVKADVAQVGSPF